METGLRRDIESSTDAVAWAKNRKNAVALVGQYVRAIAIFRQVEEWRTQLKWIVECERGRSWIKKKILLAWESQKNDAKESKAEVLARMDDSLAVELDQWLETSDTRRTAVAPTIENW